MRLIRFGTLVVWGAIGGAASVATVFAGYLLVRPELPNPRSARGERASETTHDDDGMVETFVRRVRGSIPASLTSSPFPSPQGREDERVAERLTREALELPSEESGRARELLGDALAVDPAHVPALRALATHCLQDEDSEEAQLHSARCLASAPNDRECRVTNLLALARLGRNDEAEVERCVRENPEDVTCLLLGIVGPLRRRDLPNAQRWLDRLHVAAPDAPWTVVYEADVADLSHDWVTALAKYKAGCALGVEYACKRATFLDEQAAKAAEESSPKQP